MSVKKRISSILLAMALMLMLAACGSESGEIGKKDQAENTNSVSENTAEPASEENEADKPEATEEDSADTTQGKSDVLVVYFSVTGTTKGIAEKIAGITGGDIYEITPKEPYSDADIDYNDDNSRATKEQNDSSTRPQISGELPEVKSYKTVYIGYPIWFGQEPRIMDTFVEKCSFDGVSVIPFCTSGSSGIGSSGDNLAKNAKSGNWHQGERFGSDASEDDVKNWIDSLK